MSYSIFYTYNQIDRSRMQNDPFWDKFKIIILGRNGSGASSLRMRYTQGFFDPSYQPTIGVQFGVRRLQLGHDNITMQVWDASGGERFRVITRNYYNNSQGIIIVYDMTDRQTFENVPYWVEEVQNVKSRLKPITIKYIAATHLDQEEDRMVSREEGQNMARELGFRYFEVSAKTGANVEEMFTSLAKDILENVVAERRVSVSAQKRPQIRLYVPGPVFKTCC